MWTPALAKPPIYSLKAINVRSRFSHGLKLVLTWVDVPALAEFAKKRSPVSDAQISAKELHLIPRADTFIVCKPMFAEHELLFPLQELKAVGARLANDFKKFARRQSTDGGQWMNTNAEQHFILDCVTDAGKNILVEQCIAYQHVGRLAQSLGRQPGVPQVGHDIRAPVIKHIEVTFDIAHGTRIEIQFTSSERQPQTWDAICPLINPVAAEHHQMYSDGKSRQFDEELFTETADGYDALPDQRRFVEATIAFGLADDLPGEL